jgi:hypothetical protein
MRKKISAPVSPPHEQILSIAAGFWRSRALAIATELEAIVATPASQSIPMAKTR